MDRRGKIGSPDFGRMNDFRGKKLKDIVDKMHCSENGCEIRFGVGNFLGTVKFLY